MKISETAPSSRSATRVSRGVVLTMMSLVMEGPFHEPSAMPRAVHAGVSGAPRAGAEQRELMHAPAHDAGRAATGSAAEGRRS
jgi:hypothetical protein